METTALTSYTENYKQKELTYVKAMVPRTTVGQPCWLLTVLSFSFSTPEQHSLVSSCLLSKSIKGGMGRKSTNCNYPQTSFFSHPVWLWQKRMSNLGPKDPSPCPPLISWTSLWDEHLDMMLGLGPISKVREVHILSPLHAYYFGWHIP